MKSYGSSGGEDLLVNTIGSYAGVRPIDLLDGQQVERLEIKADGPWQVDLLDLAQAQRLQVPGTISGKGDDVVLLLGGTADTAAITHEGEANFVVRAYGDGFPDLIVNEIGSYSGKVLLKGAMLLEIVADGDWTVEVLD